MVGESAREKAAWALTAREFDMVITFDAPISYTYPQHQEVLWELYASRPTHRHCLGRQSIGVTMGPGLPTLPASMGDGDDARSRPCLGDDATWRRVLSERPNPVYSGNGGHLD